MTLRPPTGLTRRTMLLLLAGLLAAGPAAAARADDGGDHGGDHDDHRDDHHGKGGDDHDDDDGHGDAREAIRRGEVKPLEQILAQVASRYPGSDVVRVKLRQKKGAWVYDIRLIDSGGRLLRLRIDAHSGAIVGLGSS